MSGAKRAELRLLAGTSALPFAEALGRALGIAAERVRVERLANQNLLCEVAAPGLEGAEVVYVQTSAPPVSEHLVETLLSLDAIRVTRPERVTAVLPYLPYARSDAPERPGGPVPARLLADLLERAGAERVLAFDLHSPQLAGFFHVPVVELSARAALVDAMRAWGLADLVVASPDFGGAKRAGRVAAALGVPLVLFRKERRGREVRCELFGDVAGRSVVLFDDEIATGSTMIAAAQLARRSGARAVFAAATHAVFVEDALARLASAGVERVLVSDTVPLGAPAGAKLELVSVVPALRDALVG